MTVEEYAIDVKVNLNSVLDKCKELGINVSTKDDFLSDDDIILLDNSINNEESYLSEELESKFDFEDRAENLLGDHIDEGKQKKVKLKKKDSTKENENFKKEKKNIYKNKTKLQSNSEVSDNIAIYKDGMTVKELASSLCVKDTDLVKKLFDLGLMINVNSSISFEDAELVSLEFNKELKKDKAVDISNFEEYEIIDK